jgi:hypothetical protein
MRGSALAVALTLALAGAGVLGVAATAAALAQPIRAQPIRAARWVAQGFDPVEALTRRPVECLAPPHDLETAYQVEVGRAAFRTPLLLGGQAARAGLACESCHRNGRTNPAFFFPGLSGAPGTADVTSALFSSHRDDGVDNPRPIPDLGGDKARLKVVASPSLRPFIHGLVTQEFDGAEPPAAVLDGLAAYVRALDPAACRPGGSEPMQVEQPVADARRAVDTAIAAIDRRDAPTAVLMVESARSQLALIDERYSALPADREAVHVAALELGGAIAQIRQDHARDARASLLAWLVHAPQWTARLQADAPRSLYDPAELRKAID